MRRASLLSTPELFQAFSVSEEEEFAKLSCPFRSAPKFEALLLALFPFKSLKGDESESEESSVIVGGGIILGDPSLFFDKKPVLNLSLLLCTVSVDSGGVGSGLES